MSLSSLLFNIFYHFTFPSFPFILVIFPPELASKAAASATRKKWFKQGVWEPDKPLARTVVLEGKRKWLERLITGTILEEWGLPLWLEEWVMLQQEGQNLRKSVEECEEGWGDEERAGVARG